MKVLVLNLWHAKCRDELEKYLKDKVGDYDVFCFQEVKDDAVVLCDDILKDFQYISDTKINNDYCHFESRMYFRKELKNIDSNIISIDNKEIGMMQYLNLSDGNKNYHIVNVHGVTGKSDNKLDNEARLVQSKLIIDLLKDKFGVKIIAGDFNILRNTNSIKMFSENGYIDLIDKNNIYTTRNKLVWDRFENKMLDSDYVFVKDGEVALFEVEDVLVSDHLPLMVEVE